MSSGGGHRAAYGGVGQDLSARGWPHQKRCTRGETSSVPKLGDLYGKQPGGLLTGTIVMLLLSAQTF